MGCVFSKPLWCGEGYPHRLWLPVACTEGASWHNPTEGFSHQKVNVWPRKPIFHMWASLFSIDFHLWCNLPGESHILPLLSNVSLPSHYLSKILSTFHVISCSPNPPPFMVKKNIVITFRNSEAPCMRITSIVPFVPWPQPCLINQVCWCGY